MTLVPLRRLLNGLLLAAAAGCVGATDPPPTEAERWERACPQTYEFGNDGCARILIIATFADTTWPDPLRVLVAMLDSIAPVGYVEPRFGPAVSLEFRLQLTDYLGWRRRFPGNSVEIQGEVSERVHYAYDASQIPPILATVATRIVPRFAPVGERPPVDTIHFHFVRE